MRIDFSKPILMSSFSKAVSRHGQSSASQWRNEHEMDYPRECQRGPCRVPLAHQAIYRQGRRVHVSSPKTGCISEAEKQGAIPFDVAGVELGHVGGRCSFESIMLKYGLTQDPALVRIGKDRPCRRCVCRLDTSPEGAGSEGHSPRLRSSSTDWTTTRRSSWKSPHVRCALRMV